MKIFNKKLIISLGIFLLLMYFLSYFILTIKGSYSEKLYPSDKYRHKELGLSVPDEMIWEPYLVERTKYHSNILGYIFYPVIKLDRSRWHNSINVVDVGQEHQISDGDSKKRTE